MLDQFKNISTAILAKGIDQKNALSFFFIDLLIIELSNWIYDLNNLFLG